MLTIALLSVYVWQVSSSVQCRTRNVTHVLKTSHVSLIKCSANDARHVVFRSALVLAWSSKVVCLWFLWLLIWC